MTIAEKLTKALNDKKNDITTFVWKGPKEDINGVKTQKEINLVDASEEELNTFYKHCHTMLHNTNKTNPGRYVLLDIIKEQKLRCNTELFLRYIENKYLQSNREKIHRFQYLQSIRDCFDNNEDNIQKSGMNRDDIPVSTFTSGVPEEFNNITAGYAISGCLDTLGQFSRKHITLTFITKCGIWFTEDELSELTEFDQNGKKRDKLEIIRERLGLKNVVKLKIDAKGLSYNEFRSMVLLKNKKYSDLTTEQLLVLRNKILFKLEDEVRHHISQWLERMRQIELVAKSKNITLSNLE